MVRFPEQLNITAYLADRQIALGHGARVAYMTDNGRTTYATLADLQNRYGNLLFSEPGSRSRIALPSLFMDQKIWLQLSWEPMKIGAVGKNNPFAPVDLYLYFLNDSRVKYFCLR